MRVSITRRALAVCGSVAIAAAVVTGCSDSNDSSEDSTAAESTVATATTESDSTTSAAATSAAAAAADPATTQAVTDTYVTFFNGTTPPATRAGLVENGDAFLPALEGMAADPQATATSATVEGVTASDGVAAVSWTLLMNGAPVLPDQSGEAVDDGGTWKVSAATFCALLAIQGDGTPVPGC